MNHKALTVSQLNMYTRSLIESDPNLRNVLVKGEISNFTKHLKSGHVYFTLKDQQSAVKVVMFKNVADRLAFFLEDGISVFVKGRVSLYERDGTYQLYADDMIPDGVGAYRLAFEKLKEKLEKQGLFDPAHKKPIPMYPQRIGVATSATGAAFKDVISVLGRRFPLSVPVLFPCNVQGIGAAESVIEAIQHFNDTKDVDVIIITRGGGSYEDLIAFNDESLAYAVYASEIPIISAVGHEIDFTIIDYVADLRAPTPSAAAELTVPDSMELLSYLQSYKKALGKSLLKSVSEYDRLLELYRKSISAENTVGSKMKDLENVRSKLYSNMDRIYSDRVQKLKASAEKMEALSPLSVLLRGYAIMSKEGKTVKSVDEVSTGENYEIKLKDGVVIGAAKEIIKNK